MELGSFCRQARGTCLQLGECEKGVVEARRSLVLT